MSDMSIQERYNEISKLSGLSEDIIRRVFKATKTSMAMSLKRGERATLPGICTITPEIKNRIDLGGNSMSKYIKLKAKPSTAMESELDKLGEFKESTENETGQENLSKLNIMESCELKSLRQSNGNGIRTKQISALL